MIDFLTIFITVLSLILLMVPGFIFSKLKLLPEGAENTCSKIVLYCCQTALAFVVFTTKSYTAEIGKNMLLVALLATAVHIIMFFIVTLFVKGKDARAKVIKYAGVFGNCGFMGIPFLDMLFKGHQSYNEVLIYAAVVIAVFNVLNWTLGVFIMTGDKKEISIKKILLNPVIIAIALGLIIFVTLGRPIRDIATAGTFGYRIIDKVMLAIEFFSDMVTPLSMFTIGMKLAKVSFKQLFFNIKAYFACSLKLLVMPLVSILLVAFLPVGVAIKYTIFLLLGMPTATSATLFSVLFNKDSEFASVVVLLSTVLSILTIPLMYLVISGVFGVVI